MNDSLQHYGTPCGSCSLKYLVGFACSGSLLDQGALIHNGSFCLFGTLDIDELLHRPIRRRDIMGMVHVGKDIRLYRLFARGDFPPDMVKV